MPTTVVDAVDEVNQDEEDVRSTVAQSDTETAQRVAPARIQLMVVTPFWEKWLPKRSWLLQHAQHLPVWTIW